MPGTFAVKVGYLVVQQMERQYITALACSRYPATVQGAATQSRIQINGRTHISNKSKHNTRIHFLYNRVVAQTRKCE